MNKRICMKIIVLLFIIGLTRSWTNAQIPNIQKEKEKKYQNYISDTTKLWVIKNRTLPPPKGASKAVFDAIKVTPQSDLENRSVMNFKNLDSLKIVLKHIDDQRLPMVSILINKTQVKIEKMMMDGVIVRKITPKIIDKAFAKSIFIHLHGGAYILNSGTTSVLEGIILANYLQIPVLSVDYRLLPEHPFPAGLEDAVSVYKKVLKDYPNYKIFLGGTSAGGGLTLATALKLKNDKIKMPTALFAGTPWTDLTKTGDSYYTNEGIDRLLVTYDGSIENTALQYANGRDLKDPYLSPVYADVSGFPPTFIITGTRDLFLSNSARMDTKLRAANVQTKLIVLEGISHADYMTIQDAPECIAAFDDLKKFFLESQN